MPRNFTYLNQYNPPPLPITQSSWEVGGDERYQAQLDEAARIQAAEDAARIQAARIQADANEFAILAKGNDRRQYVTGTRALGKNFYKDLTNFGKTGGRQRGRVVRQSIKSRASKRSSRRSSKRSSKRSSRRLHSRKMH